MKCSEIQSELSLYSDGFLTETENAAVKGHLEICPLCRQKHAELREIRMSMRQMSRPAIPAAFQNKIKRTVRAEICNVKTSRLPISGAMREWLRIRVMPYSVGVVASSVLGFTFLSMMFTNMGNTGQFSAASQGQYRTETTLLPSNKSPYRDSSRGEISAYDYAQTRLDISSESPSVNPQGALIALTKSLVRGGMKDDEVVVVADVFGNGLAQIAEVVEPSRDRQAVDELQKALDSDPAYAPFVSANLDKRSESVRVVLKFQSVSVSTGLGRHR